MQSGLETLLDIRRRYAPPGRRGGRAAAIALHALALALVILSPTLRAARPEPPEFVTVQIVPAQRLGIEKPPPPKPQPKPPAETAPEPAPETPKAEPAPPPETAPAMPAPPIKALPAPATESRPEAPQPAASQLEAPQPETPPARQGSPQGSAAGALTGAAVAGLDNPDFTYGYYVDQMLSLIRAQWLRPSLGGGIEATVHFQIARNGAVSDIRIILSSGYSSFDLSGLRAVQAASPLPPLPKGYRQDSLGVTLIIR